MLRKRCNSLCSVVFLVTVATALLLSTSSASSSTNTAGDLPQTVTIAYPYTLDSLDPAHTPLVAYLSPLVNEPLFFSGRANKLTPALATSVSTPKPTTLVFRLRKNVRFSNGEPLTAEDVAWSAEQAFADKSHLATNLPNFKSVSVSGPDTVTVNLKKATPAAVGLLAFTIFVHNKKHAQEHPNDFGLASALPIGTGPYKYASFTTNGVTLERNDAYWGPKPRIQTIKVTFISNDDTARLAMRSGSIQAYYSVGNPRAIPQWKSIPGVSIFSTEHTANSVFFSMDITRRPFNDIHVRRAIAYAVDRKGLLGAAFGGYADLLKGLVSADGFASVVPSERAGQQFLNSLPQYQFDLKKAKAELAQSAYPKGFKMTLPYWADKSYARLTALNLQQNLRSIGITVVLKPLAVGAYFGQMLQGKHRGIQIIEWPTFPQDPVGGLAYLFGRANANHFNFANFFDPTVERAWRQVTQSVDKRVRWQGVQTSLRATATQLPYIPLFNAEQLVAVGGDIKLSGTLDFMDMFNARWVLKLK